MKYLAWLGVFALYIVGRMGYYLLDTKKGWEHYLGFFLTFAIFIPFFAYFIKLIHEKPKQH